MIFYDTQASYSVMTAMIVNFKKYRQSLYWKLLWTPYFYFLKLRYNWHITYIASSQHNNLIFSSTCSIRHTQLKHWKCFNLWSLLSKVHDFICFVLSFFSWFEFCQLVFHVVFFWFVFTFLYLMNLYLCLKSKCRSSLFYIKFSLILAGKKKNKTL